MRYRLVIVTSNNGRIRLRFWRATYQVLVSVVIPAFQSSCHIAQALESVFAQTFTDYEVLVVNDGSPDTDLLEQALMPYQKRIRYLKQPNGGPSAARNTGVLQANGRLIAFLDSDDAWFPGHIANQLAMLAEEPSLGLVYSDSILMKEGVVVGHAFGQQPQHPPVTFESLLAEDCAIGTSSVVASRDALINAGLFDEQFSRCEDFDLWLRMAFRGTRMNYCREPSLYHLLSPDGLSSSLYLMKCALIDVYGKIASTMPVSKAQEKLIQQCIRRTKVRSQLDLLKQHSASGEYPLALEAAERARTLAKSAKLNWAIFGLKRAPHVFKHAYNTYERWSHFRDRLRATHSARSLKRFQPHAELIFDEGKLPPRNK